MPHPRARTSSALALLVVLGVAGCAGSGDDRPATAALPATARTLPRPPVCGRYAADAATTIACRTSYLLCRESQTTSGRRFELAARVGAAEDDRRALARGFARVQYGSGTDAERAASVVGCGAAL